MGIWFYTFIVSLQIVCQVKYFVGVVLEIADYLKIPIFKVKPKSS